MNRRNIILAAAAALMLVACVADSSRTNGASVTSTPRVLIFGASGRIGGHIVEEALLQGYAVTAVSRDAERLNHLRGRAAITMGDVLDHDRLDELIDQHDAILVSVGGAPVSEDPADYIAHTAAQSLLAVMVQKKHAQKRLIFVGNLFTLIYEDGKTLLELGRVPDTHPNYEMFHGHQLALDAFRNSSNVRWTVASPPNGLRLQGRTAKVRWGGETLLRDADGSPSTISPEDFAYAVLEEVQNGNYIGKQFNVAR